MSIKVMSRVWETEMPAMQKLVLLAIADCANDEGLAWPSIATLARKSGCGERTVQRNIRDLEAAGLLKREEVAGRGCRYWVNPRQSDTPATVTPPPERHPTPARVTPHPRQSGTQTVKNHKEPSDSPHSPPRHFRMKDWPAIPDWVPVEEWNAWVAMRKRKRAMPTARAVELTIQKLEGFRNTGQDPGAVLDQSTEHGWTGIFELKDDRNGRNRSATPAGNSGDEFSRAARRWANLGDAEEPAPEPDGRAVQPGEGHRQGTLALPQAGHG